MIKVRRRRLAAAALTGLAMPALLSGAQAQQSASADTPHDISRVEAAVDRFAKVASAVSCSIVAGAAPAAWEAAHQPAERLFVGSAVKTFILAEYLRGVEAKRLSENRPLAIDDRVRSPGSPVFAELAGQTAARNVLEAMICHSDNTATDAALAAVGVERVRALIKEAGLGATQVPDSTRRLFTFLASGRNEDPGWPELLQLLEKPTKVQPALNPTQTMASTAHDLVKWYQAALTGRFFKEAATLIEFKRIQAMADALPFVVPADTPACGKGGSIDWQDFHCFCLAGQMIVRTVPVTFCFTINWRGPEKGVAPTFKAYKEAVADVLGEAAKITS